MKKILQYLSKINPFYFALSYVLSTFLSTVLLYKFHIFDLSTSLTDLDTKGFFTSFYFSLITITTLGYGDIVPGNNATRVLASCLAITGIILTGLFLNSLAFIITKLTEELDKNKLKEEQYYIQLQKLKDIYILLKPNFEDYKYASNSVITPLSKHDQLTDLKRLLDNNFTLRDFIDIFKPNPLRRFSFSKMRIEVYYDNYERLINNLDELTKLGYFSLNNELLNKIVTYLSDSSNLNSKDNILAASKNARSKEMDLKMLENSSGEEKISEISNAIDDYLILKYQIELTIKLIGELDSTINKLINEKALT
jgi:hypothetical protein